MTSSIMSWPMNHVGEELQDWSSLHPIDTISFVPAFKPRSAWSTESPLSLACKAGMQIGLLPMLLAMILTMTKDAIQTKRLLQVLAFANIWLHGVQLGGAPWPRINVRFALWMSDWAHCAPDCRKLLWAGREQSQKTFQNLLWLSHSELIGMMSDRSGNRKNWQWTKPNWLEPISLIQFAKPSDDSKQSIAACGDQLHAHSQFDARFCSVQLWHKLVYSRQWLWHCDSCLDKWVGEDTILAMSVIFSRWST